MQPRFGGTLIGYLTQALPSTRCVWPPPSSEIQTFLFFFSFFIPPDTDSGGWRSFFYSQLCKKKKKKSYFLQVYCEMSFISLFIFVSSEFSQFSFTLLALCLASYAHIHHINRAHMSEMMQMQSVNTTGAGTESSGGHDPSQLILKVTVWLLYGLLTLLNLHLNSFNYTKKCNYLYIKKLFKLSFVTMNRTSYTSLVSFNIFFYKCLYIFNRNWILNYDLRFT